ncbi:hypothetical protein ACFOWM_03610 [Ferruginibacter yonginensis]|uniref:Uncharacterized protein n=1 Tax=Ferruginibacter yonginensis TaxID=1310416 RepID=A0ABV8QNU4_9BACT
MSHTQIRVVDASFNPVLRVRYETFRAIKDVLRTISKGVYVINKNKVRQLHGGTWLKQHYKKQLKSN